MTTIQQNLEAVRASLPTGVTLVAVSKYHPAEAIREAYEAGQRVFGESKVQELTTKVKALPNDIEWHFIGHLQTNKVKQLIPHVALIHSVDSERLLDEISKQAVRAERTVDVLLQLHVAQEETKYGFTPDEVVGLLLERGADGWAGIRIRGIMGMASLTDDEAQIRREFGLLKQTFNLLSERIFAQCPWFDIRSYGMSDDYPLAVEEGSTMVRVGSRIFGARVY